MEEIKNKQQSFEIEKKEFSEWAEKIRETSLRLQEEREKVLEEKAQYDFERE